MKRTTKFLASTSGMLAVAAFSGLISGAAMHASAQTTGLKARTATMAVVGKAGASARNLDGSSSGHACKGQNSCKGTGGCNTGDQGCKGKNTCSGKGGCKTNGSL